jgi:penicillin-binding protein 2
MNKLQSECEKQREKDKSSEPCLISDGREWTVGDEVSLSVGQGDMLASPLQMAVVYAALANGGTVVRPHFATAVLGEDGQVDQQLKSTPVRKINFPPGYDAVLEGLHQATTAAGGTSSDVFSGWPQNRLRLYGKTGTAERAGHPDMSWYASFVNDPKRPIVLVMGIEDAHFGAEAAAPAACEVLAYWYKVDATCAPGEDHSL